jgi:hypothetical protein
MALRPKYRPVNPSFYTKKSYTIASHEDVDYIQETGHLVFRKPSFHIIIDLTLNQEKFSINPV